MARKWSDFNTMIVLICGEKGGSGKSTMATNVAAFLGARGDDVVLVDADRQGTSSRWAQYREENEELPVVNCVQRHDKIARALKDLDKRYAFVVVDVAGRDSTEMRSAFLAAHVAIVPLRPSQADLDTLPHIADVVAAASDLNPELSTFALLTMASTNPVVTEAKIARQYLSEYPEFQLLKAVIRDRKIYRDAMSEGCGVIEMGNAKAKDEIRKLMREIAL